MFDNKGRFIIEDYAKQSTFSSFLPGISGKFGIPIWCFYVNRGQAIACFGVEDKDHSIMEFYPAHQAYQFTKTIGFRTFLKVDQMYYEAFSNENNPHKMYIGMNELEIEEKLMNLLQINVSYFTLPNEKLGGLVRKVTIKNIDKVSHNVQVLDGMPAIIPYGVNLGSMKEMGQTTKAWMQVENLEEKLPYFKVRASMEDSVDVREVKGGHFYFAVDESGTLLPVLVDPSIVFSYDTSLMKAVGFEQGKLEDLLTRNQVVTNNLPCSFFAREKALEPDEAITLFEVVGQVNNKEILREFAKQCMGANFFLNKQQEAVELTEELCKGIDTKTASKTFDAYCKQTYLDNVLRGGYPTILGKDKIFYLYSRKHGDIERDYNYFCMLAEVYSQGNANFRDVNQNRRSDVLFAPFVKAENIKTFYNLIQIDGYNPLSVQKATYTLKEEKLQQALTLVKDRDKVEFEEFLEKPFTPGSLLAFYSEKTDADAKEQELFLDQMIDLSSNDIAADFGEGYWVDHWTYNLDLIETFLSVYPDHEEELLYLDSTYTYFESKAIVNPRSKRYVKTDKGIRQFNPLDKAVKKEVKHKQLRCNYGKGKVYHTTLMEKLLLLSAIKFATLDVEGMGIEMEAGKPGWYDAMNGLPGIFGSSMCETLELQRLIEFVRKELKKYSREVTVAIEVKELITKLNDVVGSTWKGIHTWNQVNCIKEEYRDKTVFGIDGTVETMSSSYLLEVLGRWSKILKVGIMKAMEHGKGICPTYFYYHVTDYNVTDNGIEVRKFELNEMPYFLEGPVRYLKLGLTTEEKKQLYGQIKKSNLYDKKLKMYKINESLNKASYEVGRSTAFTPGWLENESIWLHMEYKYLLELLKSELFEEYFEDFHNALIPFLDAKIYGRSILENSSFIASSANPDEKIHGKGFVARLSGSTAEFVQMWQIMMFGKQPFSLNQKELTLSFQPIIPEYLIDDTRTIKATFLGTVKVTYELEEKKALIPGTYDVISYTITYRDGSCIKIMGKLLDNEATLAVRNGEIESILVTIR